MTETEKNIRVAILVPYKIYPATLGGQKAISFFYTFLGKLLPVTIISTKNNIPPENPTFELLPLLSNSRLRYINPFLFFKVKKIIAEEKISHFILEHPYYGWLGLLIKVFTSVKLLIRSHNIEATRFKSVGKWWWRILFIYEKIIYKKADAIFFITGEDLKFAVDVYKINAAKCEIITYGLDFDRPPSIVERERCKKIIQATHGFSHSERIFLFNGALGYRPNLNAIKVIVEKINPLLLQQNVAYKILICGSGLPNWLNDLQNFKNIIYAGFVDDIATYFKGSDVFINPVIEGGGIKTKIVEALGYNMDIVTTKSGAAGIPSEICNNKMKVIADNNWISFAEAMIVSDNINKIPLSFFEHFYWGNIAAKAQKKLIGEVL